MADLIFEKVPPIKRLKGIVVYHSQINQMFKVTYEHDDTGKPE